MLRRMWRSSSVRMRSFLASAGHTQESAYDSWPYFETPHLLSMPDTSIRGKTVLIAAKSIVWGLHHRVDVQSHPWVKSASTRQLAAFYASFSPMDPYSSVAPHVQDVKPYEMLRHVGESFWRHPLTPPRSWFPASSDYGKRGPYGKGSAFANYHFKKVGGLEESIRRRGYVVDANRGIHVALCIQNDSFVAILVNDGAHRAAALVRAGWRSLPVTVASWNDTCANVDDKALPGSVRAWLLSLFEPDIIFHRRRLLHHLPE